VSEQKNWQLRPEHSGCLLRLQKILERVRGFRVLILQHNRPRYRDGMIVFLRAAEPDSSLLDLKELGSFAAFEAGLGEYSLIRQLHLINLEALPKAEQQAFFKGLNYHREHIARTCSGILLFWLPEHLINQLAVQAPDFWAWREQVLDFSVPLEPVERNTVNSVKNRNLEVSGKLERIREIEEFLARPAEEPSLTVADLKRELGNLYKLIGEYGEAEQMLKRAITDYRELDEAKACAHARYNLAVLMAAQGEYEQALTIFREQVLPINESLNDVRNKAVTMGQIADILRKRGQLDEALEIYHKEMLPVFEQLGDIRTKAVGYGRIADIFRARGELDKALEIYRNKELPVYERLGDVREKATTMGKIADILRARGEIDKALDIRQKEQLPIYERLGDIREKALTMGKIADILQARGQLDETLRIREQEELPIYDRLGDVHSLLVTRTKIAFLLHEIDAKAHKERIEELLRLALTDAKRLKLLGEIEWIEGIMKKLGVAADGDGAE
jgi:tetratricopeptide (TPR) repeat protein